ncbi:MAG TPA: hypothetical protein VEH01_03565 [Nitrososphaerales archaeon]|nr:hypothetical protein [Nitrososphaerales archaeon]
MVSASLVLAAMIVSAVAFTREVGPQFDLRSRRAGIPVAVLGLLGYIEGTSVGSPFLHVLSIAVFYWGSVLYLSGTRSFVSTIPSGVIVVSLAFPSAYGAVGLIYLDVFSWVLLVVSAVLLVLRGSGPAPPSCGLCAGFSDAGKSFCSSCGRYLKPPPAPAPRKLLGFAVFTVVMLAALSVTVPLLVTTPAVSLDSMSIGGSGVTNHFAPLQGWGVRETSTTADGLRVDEYSFTNGRLTIEALVSESGDSAAAAQALNATRRGAVPDASVPPAISRSMSGYTLTTAKTKYVGLDGVFQVGLLNDSSISTAFVAVDLRQTSASFDLDTGSALYAAALGVINWASGSAGWTLTAGEMLSGFQYFSQTAYAVSFGAVGVVLFTLSRDDELGRVRKLESMHGLGAHETAVLGAFQSSKPTKGADLFDSALKSNPWILEGTFFTSLDETVRRGLVAPYVEIARGRPSLYWRRLV